MSTGIIPRNNSFRDRICRTFAAHGPMILDELIEHIPNRRAAQVIAAVHQLKFYKTLVLENGTYSLSRTAAIHYGVVDPAELEEAQPPAVIDTFRPLSRKNMGWLIHADKLREISFHTAGVAFPSGVVL